MIGPVGLGHGLGLVGCNNFELDLLNNNMLGICRTVSNLSLGAMLMGAGEGT